MAIGNYTHNKLLAIIKNKTPQMVTLHQLWREMV